VVDEFGLFGAKLINALPGDSGERVVEDRPARWELIPSWWPIASNVIQERRSYTTRARRSACSGVKRRLAVAMKPSR
jgi:hypothetical protein